MKELRLSEKAKEENILNVKKDILNTLKNEAKDTKRKISLPRDIDFEFLDNTLIMYLKKKAIGIGYKNSKGKLSYTNMQADAAAFEGWAVVIKTYWNKDCDYNVRLDILDSELDELPNPTDVFMNKGTSKKGGHYGRFLFRASKFSEEYSWFNLSEKIKKSVDIYEQLLKEHKCRNHLPDKDAGVNDHLEIQIEESFYENPNEIVKITNNKVIGKIYRQLGVWLESDDANIQFLTSGRSAIDLWNITGNTLNVFELKAGRNYKVGIITELFMYMEYCHDMFLKGARFSPRSMAEDNTLGRGYGKLVNAKIENINGFFLSNKFHPLLTDKVITVLNDNLSGMIYAKLPEYDLEYMLSIKRKQNI